MREAWISQNSDKKNYFKDLKTMDDFPQSMEKILMETSLLYHVPFYYLIPDRSLIPEESLQFFSIDYNWVLAYMDGVCSVGRNAGIDYMHDTELLINIYKKALEENEKIRKVRQNSSGEARDAAEMEDMCASGFFLHSVLVEDFRGIEIRSYSDIEGKERLSPLRIEKMGKQILLGIFKGKIRRIEFVQPPEGLHYGFIRSEGKMYKTLRNIENGELNDQQTEIFKRDGDSRTLDLEKTAQEMERQLGRHITAADLGLQLIQNAQTGVFKMEAADENK